MNIVTILSYMTIYIVWGITYYAIRLAVDTIPPFYVVGTRFLIGGVALLLLCALQGRLRGLTFKNVAMASIVGCLLMIGGNGPVTIAQQRVDSYIAALIITATPLVVLIYDRLLWKKHISKSAIAAIIMGFLGVGLLLNNGHSLVPQVSPYALLIVLAMVLWGLGTSISKHVSQPEDPLTSSAIQLCAAGIVALVAVQPFTPLTTVAWGAISGSSLAGLTFLTVFGGVALVAYSYLLKHEPNNRIVTYAFVNPPIAVLIGMVVGKERAVPFLIPGVILIGVALVIMFYGGKIFARFKKTQEGSANASHES